ncbi:MAG: DUF2207 domain-containing protein [Flavobacteriales bacterium]
MICFCQRRWSIAVIAVALNVLSPFSQIRAQSSGYTSATGALYSAKELDSLYRVVTFQFLEKQRLPALHIEKKYPEILPLLQAAAGNQLEIELDRKFRKEKISREKIPSDKRLALREKYDLILKQFIDEQLRDQDVIRAMMYYKPDDRISHFHSDMHVRKDGILEVKETITVQNPDDEELPYFTYVMDRAVFREVNNEIKHGLRREIPTAYYSEEGFVANAPIEIKEIKLDGAEVPFFTEKATNGIVLYIGDKYENLSFGEHVYEISYEAQRQVVFMEDHDEIYVNVTGNGWTLEMDRVTCDIEPGPAQPIGDMCYTGKFGSRLRECSSWITKDDIVHFATNGGLETSEGLTISVQWPKGSIDSPARIQKWWSFIRDNWGISLLGILFLFLGIYNTLAWFRMGRDAKRGVVFPQFDPPTGMSPAAIGFVADQKFSSRLAAAELTHLAVKKVILLDQSETRFEITRVGEEWPTDMPELLGNRLEALNGKRIVHGEYSEELHNYYNALEHHVQAEYQEDSSHRKSESKALFRKNSGQWIFGLVLISLAVIGAGIFCATHPTKVIILSCVIILAMLIIGQIIFARIIAAYNTYGRKIMDHIEGFKMYLIAAEERVLNAMTIPAKTPELFEKYLPYAMALNCENEWADQFNDVFKSTLDKPEESGSYHQSFGSRYFHHRSSFNISTSLTRTISSANILPSSSSSGGSSFGGGGFSGGGSMGGGGGGW